MITDPARELAIRIESQEDLYFFSRYMFKERRKYKWMHNWHHRVVCDALMKIYRGETKRLIINVPPRYSKTELAVINFMAWCFGKVPDCEFIHISYSATLAANNAFQTRNLVQETAFMAHDLKKFEAAVNNAVKVPLNQNQFDALVSLAYNIGTNAFSGSTLVKKLNANDIRGAADQFDVWVNAGGKRMQGLVNRRAKEKALFLS